jgi:hypothetical protein
MPANPYAMWTLTIAAYTGLPAASVTVSSTEQGPAPPSISGTSCVGWDAELGRGEAVGVDEGCVCAPDRAVAETKIRRRMQQRSLISILFRLYFGWILRAFMREIIAPGEAGCGSVIASLVDREIENSQFATRA